MNQFNSESNKNKFECFPNKLRRFKPPLVPSKDFPSRVSLIKESQATVGEDAVIESDDNLVNAGKYNENKPLITHWRRAEFTDREAVTQLIEKSYFQMNDLFGEPDVPNLIEKSSFALVQFNSEEEIISFTSLFSYPDIPAVPSFEWYPWLEKSYRLKDATPRNTFFIHYTTWDPRYHHEFLKLTLETVFLENSFLSNIIITKPPKVKLPNFVQENFVQVLPVDAELYDCDCNSLQTLFLCLRHSLLERLKIRLALVEDHDDLMPIAEQHTDKLRELYGEYCLAEIIEFPGTTDRKTLVCESKGYAVGFMIISRSVDFELLNSQFHLGVFHGLKKPSPTDKIAGEFAEDDEERPVYLPEKVDPFLQIINSEEMIRFLNWQPSLCVTEDDLSSVKSTFSEGLTNNYNEQSNSMTLLIKDTLNVKLVPKFSAHALSLSGSVLSKATQESTSSSTLERLFTGSTVSAESSIQSEQSLISLQYYNLPIYNGTPNAFCIEFYAMHNEFDDRLCQDFLEAAFEVFPDLEYCLLTIPSQSPTFPLLDYFTRVTPRPLKRFRQELYVCHKSSVMVTFMRVRRLEKSDLLETQKLLKGIKNQEYIYADAASSCYYQDSAYQAFVLICSKSIVGIAVLCNEHGMEYLAHHYHVSDLIDFDLHKIDYHAILKHLILSPIYQPHARFFLRDIMRMADVTSLYRARYEEAESNWNKSSIITTLGQLIPVSPRRMVKYHEPSLGPNIPPSYFLQKELPFSLYHINSRVCGLQKFTSNINVVVVGASTTAYSFLEALLFAPSSAYVTFNNITWVAPHGMGTELPSHEARDLMFPFKGKYSRFYKMQICLKAYVNFVYGVMTYINRTDKYIMINNDSILPYDYLILLCGRQYVMPVPLALVKDSNVCRRNYRPRCSLFKYLIAQQPKKVSTEMIYPPNVFIINTDVDATNAFITLQYLIQKNRDWKNEKIIIYGHKISTYLCINSLLKYGIHPKMIAVVEPFPAGTKSISCFGDEKIDKAVIKTISELGIDHYLGFVLYDWTLCQNKQVQSAVFHSNHRKVTINCLAMFPFERKSVSDVTFHAINEASLVYDGKLVINNSFQTNDPYIYAAGGLTKYQRKYYAKNKNHKNYSENEVGKYLANIIKKKIDPTEENVPQEEAELVPKLIEPLVTYGVLPGDWYFLRVQKPGELEDFETKAGIKEFGDILITGDCEMSGGYGYFKLMLDDFGFVSGILCYTKDVIDWENLEMLYGKHEKLLNDLLLQFDLGIITDFYSYFREPWIYALYHNQFKYVMWRNNDIFYEEKENEKEKRLIDVILKTLRENNWQRPSKEKLKEIKERFEESDLKKQITENILSFLYYFDEPFPMYATPRILRVLLHDAGKSLLHKFPRDSNTSFRPAIRISEMVPDDNKSALGKISTNELNLSSNSDSTASI